MILTCPNCATRYFVEAANVGPRGRTVRCAACRTSWRAEAEPPPPAVAPEPPDAAAAALEPARAGDALLREIRAKDQAKRRTRKAVAAGAVWGAWAAGFALLLLAAAVFRAQVVQLWPRTAGAYAAVRLPVNPLGLAPDAVQAAPGLLDGRAALTVTGVERNVDAAPRPPAPLRVSLYDRSGRRLAQKIVQVGDPPIRPGEGRPFRVSFIDPPLTGAQVGVDFVFEPRPAGRPAAAPRLRARGSGLPLTSSRAVRAAEALPPGSPYALPIAAEAQALQARPRPSAAGRSITQPHG